MYHIIQIAFATFVFIISPFNVLGQIVCDNTYSSYQTFDEFKMMGVNPIHSLGIPYVHVKCADSCIVVRTSDGAKCMRYERRDNFWYNTCSRINGQDTCVYQRYLTGDTIFEIEKTTSNKFSHYSLIIYTREKVQLIDLIDEFDSFRLHCLNDIRHYLHYYNGKRRFFYVSDSNDSLFFYYKSSDTYRVFKLKNKMGLFSVVPGFDLSQAVKKDYAVSDNAFLSFDLSPIPIDSETEMVAFLRSNVSANLKEQLRNKRIVLRLLLNENGIVDTVQCMSAINIKDALETCLNKDIKIGLFPYVFRPGIVLGKSVCSWYYLSMSF